MLHHQGQNNITIMYLPSRYRHSWLYSSGWFFFFKTLRAENLLISILSRLMRENNLIWQTRFYTCTVHFVRTMHKAVCFTKFHKKGRISQKFVLTSFLQALWTNVQNSGSGTSAVFLSLPNHKSNCPALRKKMLGNIPYLINSGAILREEGIDNLKITNHETKYTLCIILIKL